MATNDTETLGRRIARLRLEHGMTQERLADLMNVSAQAVSKWENNQSYPDILSLPKLAQVLDVTVDELLGAGETAPAEEPVVEAVVEPEVAPEPEPEPEPEPYYSATPLGDALRAAREAAEKAEEEPEVVEPEVVEETVARKATKLRILITEDGRDQVNLSIPLGISRFLAGITRGIPGLTVEDLDGIDLPALLTNFADATPGTLIDIEDEGDNTHVNIAFV